MSPHAASISRTRNSVSATIPTTGCTAQISLCACFTIPQALMHPCPMGRTVGQKCFTQSPETREMTRSGPPSKMRASIAPPRPANPRASAPPFPELKMMQCTESNTTSSNAGVEDRNASTASDALTLLALSLILIFSANVHFHRRGLPCTVQSLVRCCYHCSQYTLYANFPSASCRRLTSSSRFSGKQKLKDRSPYESPVICSPWAFATSAEKSQLWSA